MKVHELISTCGFCVVNEGEHMDSEISTPYCCDLLSIVMGSAPAGAAWVTVMNNVNTLGVAFLADVSCVILSCGTNFDSAALQRAQKEGITILSTPLPSFDAALEVYQAIHG
ncbi:MAG: hypothetical protein RR364_00410 [Lachnospiraceae bacterium]